MVAIAAGSDHCVALKSDGSVVVWGYSGAGQTTVPSQLRNVVAIGAGDSHSLAVVSDGTFRHKVPLSQAALGPAGFTISLPTTQSGGVYLLEYKNSLNDSNWIGLPLVPGNGRAVQLTDPATNAVQRFYRVRAW